MPKEIINANTLVLLALQMLSSKDKPNWLKEFGPVYDPDLFARGEAVCLQARIDCENGDVITIEVADNENMLHVTFTPVQKETDPSKIIKGYFAYTINPWPDAATEANVGSYVSKIIHAVNDIVAKYEDGAFEVMCALGFGIGPNGDDPSLNWCKDAEFLIM